MTQHVSMDDRYAHYQRSAKPEIQHLQPGDSQEYVFWVDVNTLTLRGRLSDVWELLQLHSEVRSVVEYTSTPEDRRGLADLQELFLSHRELAPFVALSKMVYGSELPAMGEAVD